MRRHLLQIKPPGKEFCLFEAVDLYHSLFPVLWYISEVEEFQLS